MAILNYYKFSVYQGTGNSASPIFVASTDSYASVTTAGYLAAAIAAGLVIEATDVVCVSYSGGAGWFMPSNASSAGAVTLSGVNVSPSGGNLIAGSNGSAGYVESFPAVALSGVLKMAAVTNSSGNFNTTISNAASVGQSQVISIPDVGAATGQFLAKTAALVSGNFPQASGTAGLVVDSGFNSANVLLIAQVSMTAAQWNGMYAAPFLLIAAPGANKMIVVKQMQAVMTFVSADYAAGGVVAAQYDSTAHGAGVLASNSEAAADFFAAASTVFQFEGANGNTVGALPFSTCANKGLYLSNATAPFTTGDSTWIIKVAYQIISTNS
jgi:hypothetical protein